MKQRVLFRVQVRGKPLHNLHKIKACKKHTQKSPTPTSLFKITTCFIDEQEKYTSVYYSQNVMKGKKYKIHR